MMDFQLTLPHVLRRVETYYGDNADRHAAAGQELPPHDVGRRSPRARGSSPSR